MQVSFSGHEIVAMVIAASFAAGINVYATLATIGLLGRYGILPIPQNLQLVEDWWVIGAAIALFLIEFIADKIPGFDLIWNALQTFVRVPIAALLGYQATAQLSPQAQLLSTLLAGGNRTCSAQREDRRSNGGDSIAGTDVKHWAEFCRRCASHRADMVCDHTSVLGGGRDSCVAVNDRSGIAVRGESLEKVVQRRAASFGGIGRSCFLTD